MRLLTAEAAMCSRSAALATLCSSTTATKSFRVSRSKVTSRAPGDRGTTAVYTSLRGPNTRFTCVGQTVSERLELHTRIEENAMTPTHLRFGAVSLAASAVSFAIFPLVRPYFPLDPREPVATLGAAGPAVASAPWVLAHAIAMAAFVLLLVSLPVLYSVLARTDAEPRAWRALVTSIGGIALIMPTLGVETYVLPAIGRLYLDGRADIAPMIGLIYRGPTTLVMLLGLVLLAAGAIMFARPRFTGPACSLDRPVSSLQPASRAWLPLLPPPVRIADGLRDRYRRSSGLPGACGGARRPACMATADEGSSFLVAQAYDAGAGKGGAPRLVALVVRR